MVHINCLVRFSKESIRQVNAERARAISSPCRTDARPRHCGLISTCRVSATGARDGSAGTVVGSASTAGSAIGTVIPAGRMNASVLSIVTRRRCLPAVELKGGGNSTI
jgi:hypothetical protein